MRFTSLTGALCAAMAISPAAVLANEADTGPEVSLYLGLGLDFGGDDIIRVDYVGGGSDEVEAGAGVHFAIGADVDIDERYLVRGTLGYKVDSVTAENGDIEFRRLPLELTGYRLFGRHGIGAGFTLQRGGKFSCDVSGLCDFSEKVDDASGILVEYLYRAMQDNGQAYSFGIRASSGIEYSLESGGEDVDGDFIGINVGATL